MLSFSRAAVAALALGLAPTALVAACQPSLPPIQLCGEIPAGGCPAGRGGSCDDPTCEALYDCVDGKWTHKTPCAPHPDDGGTDAGTDADAATDGGPDLDACTPFMFDHHGEAVDCMPDLENPPDCPAAAAEGCLESACLTGCDDFYLCTKDGWVDVGYCDDDGTFHDTQQK